jgi:hypothetical protein
MDRGSRVWDWVWRACYRLIRVLDPLIRSYLALGGWGLQRVVDLRVRGRRTATERSVLLTLLTVGDRGYVGHPNGRSRWVRDLDAAGEAVLVVPGDAGVVVRATRVAGTEREAVIRSTAHQQPFPANVLYRASRGHILRVGAYYRLEATDRQDA